MNKYGIIMEKNDFSDNRTKNLSSVLGTLTTEIDDDQTTIGNIAERFKDRGFGPLLLVPSLVVILPTGAIPLVPALAGLIISFVCIQMLIGREHPWLPKQLKQLSIPKSKLQKAVRHAKPYTKKIDKVLRKRLSFLVNPFSKRLTALLCLLLSLAMIFIGFIPMLPATVALPIFLFGLGYIVQDGLVIAIGFLALLGSAFGLVFYILN
jgi:hypothetical protein